jgi:hypothetical protein
MQPGRFISGRKTTLGATIAPYNRASPRPQCMTANGKPLFGSNLHVACNIICSRQQHPCSQMQAYAAGARSGMERCRHAASSTPRSKQGSRINEPELLAAIQGVREFSKLPRGQQFQLVSVSCVTVHVVRNWTSRSPRFLAHLLALHALGEACGITLPKRHHPSVLNPWSDRLFQTTEQCDIGTLPDFFSLVGPTSPYPASRWQGAPAAQRPSSSIRADRSDLYITNFSIWLVAVSPSPTLACVPAPPCV